MPRLAEVWFVENCGNSPGRIAAVFKTEALANNYIKTYPDQAITYSRNVHTKQPEDKEYAE